MQTISDVGEQRVSQSEEGGWREELEGAEQEKEKEAFIKVLSRANYLATTIQALRLC